MTSSNFIVALPEIGMRTVAIPVIACPLVGCHRRHDRTGVPMSPV
jgi:hypothetical protein